MKDLSYKTATGRTAISKPTRILKEKKLLKGKILDFGCGKGFDAYKLKCDKYDPYHYPIKLTGKYDTIFCVYVLNTREVEHEDNIINEIKALLKSGGTAFIAVRRNIKEGYTSIDTYQRNVVLSFPIVYKDRDCCIYKMRLE